MFGRPWMQDPARRVISARPARRILCNAPTPESGQTARKISALGISPERAVPVLTLVWSPTHRWMQAPLLPAEPPV